MGRGLVVALLFIIGQDGVVPGDAKVEKVATGYGFTEGPAADAEGNVWFTDIPNERILKFDVATGKAEIMRSRTGRANGLAFDAKGRLHACEGGNRRVTRPEGDKAVVLADAFEGKKLNSPNDLDLDEKGGVYFTDPRYGKRDDLEQTLEGVYYVNPDGKVLRVIDDLKRPNGVVLSPDGRTLYVADNAAGAIFAYDVKDDGTVGKGREFARAQGPDGIAVDTQGNLYAAARDGIRVWDKAGKALGTIEVPETPSNCAFGGKDRRTLYVTARTSLYRIPLNVSGR